MIRDIYIGLRTKRALNVHSYSKFSEAFIGVPTMTPDTEMCNKTF